MISIKDKIDCCGCSACVQTCPKQCIRLEEDNEGFLYPSVNKSLCVECGQCDNVCPMLHGHEPQEPVGVYAATNPDEGIRMQSSSEASSRLSPKTLSDRAEWCSALRSMKIGRSLTALRRQLTESQDSEARNTSRAVPEQPMPRLNVS